MYKKGFLFLTIVLAAMMMNACEHDWYGRVFINRKPVTFQVLSVSGQSLPDVEVKAEELDALDYDPILEGLHYTRTDSEGMATVDAVYNPESGHYRLGERTTRFTFTTTDYSLFDTVFNYWDGIVEIILTENGSQSPVGRTIGRQAQ